MNLQEILSYRKNCLIHSLPMQIMNSPTRIKLPGKTTKVTLIPEGFLYDKKRIFNYDGTCTPLHNELPNSVPFPWTLAMICAECAKTPIHNYASDGRTSPENIKHSVHFYTFNINLVVRTPMPIIYECHPGLEIIKYTIKNKFYHLTGTIGGGKALFATGFLDRATIQQLADSAFILNTPQFNPSRIHSLDQMVEKIQIYSLFS
jgi:hypothetical protein